MIHASNITGTGLASHSTVPSFTGLYFLPCPNPSCPLFKNSPIISTAVYSNAELQKSQILKENKGKAGVYLIFFC
jgi:hypothetical protein